MAVGKRVGTLALGSSSDRDPSVWHNTPILVTLTRPIAARL